MDPVIATDVTAECSQRIKEETRAAVLTETAALIEAERNSWQATIQELTSRIERKDQEIRQLISDQSALTQASLTSLGETLAGIQAAEAEEAEEAAEEAEEAAEAEEGREEAEIGQENRPRSETPARREKRYRQTG